MAVGFGASGRYLRRTANLPAIDSFTIAAWVKVVSIRGSAYQYFMGLEDAATNSSSYILLGFNNSGAMELALTSSSTTLTTPSTGVWLFVSLVGSTFAGGAELKARYRALSDTTHTTHAATMTVGTFTPAASYLAADSYDEWCDIQAGPVYMFNRSLSETELFHLSYTIRPNVVGTMPILWSPLWSTSDVKDYSGNGYDWTVGGTLSNADNPPVSWGARPWLLPFVAAGGGGTTYNQSASGTLTPAGAMTRQTNKVAAGTLTTAGATVRSTAKSLAGTLTTAGAAIKQAAKSLAGTLSTSGALATARIYLAALTGTLTPAGTLAKQAGKSMAGTLTSAGALVRSTAKSLAGTLASAGALVADFISGSTTFSQAVGGTLTTAGSLARSTSKSLAGTLTTAGTISRQIAKSLAGTLTTAGSVLREWFSPSAAKLDVTLTDARVYTCTLTDARVYTCTLTDARVYTVTLGDATV